ncbi:Golgi-associated plant pathogenesis-related protein 1 [Exaiptasia diaphana]|nr:Golgi-associated plant pathogenesis-related protein 1 [Exaiptasia diaphana]
MMRKTVIVLLVFAVVLALQVHEAESRDCRDQGQYANHCPYWKRLGYCASGGKYHSWMMKNCKKTCSGCGATNANTNQKNHGNSGNNGNHQNACLRIHNTLRRKHGVPDLSWDYELASKALQYARKLAYTNTFKHDKERGRGIGENLFASSNPKSTVEEATQAWYDEIKYYNFNNPGFSMKTGHFTQVVWKGTTRLGCGIATTSRRAVVVARYAPAGNVNSKAYFRANVPRPR